MSIVSRLLIFTALVTGGFCSSAANGHNPGYLIYNLGTLPGGSTTVAMSVNNGGQVAGYCWITSEQQWHGFMWEDGAMTDLGPTIGGPDFLASAINDKGQIAGWELAVGTGMEQAAIIKKDGTIQRILDHPAVDRSFAYDINEAGQVAGYAHVPVFNRDIPFVWKLGVTTPLDMPAGITTGYAHGINNNGEVTGYGWDPVAGTWSAVVWNAGLHPQALGSLAVGGNSQGYAINDQGQVTGWTDIEGGEGSPTAFVWTDGVMEALPSLGTGSSFGNAINNGSEVVGSAFHVGNQIYHAVAWRLGVISNLNALLPPGSEWDYMAEATDISDIGQIIGYGYIDGEIRSFLLEPLLTLTTPIPGNSGEINRFDCAGAKPGNEVIFVYGFNWGTQEVPGCSGVYFDINKPALLNTAIADAKGHAVFDMFVPKTAKYKVVIFQAYEPNTCDVAVAITWTFY